MKRQNSGFLVLALALLMLVLLTVPLAGCGSGTDSGANGNGNGNGDGNGDGNGGGGLISMMKKVPISASGLGFVDFSAIRADDDLEVIYDECRNQVQEDLAQLGIRSADVETWAKVGSLTILQGTFSLADIRVELKDNDYYEDEYKGIETWGGSPSVALVSTSSIVYGGMDSVEDCLDVIKGEADSVYDDAELRDIIGRLPAGPFASASIYRSSSSERGNLKGEGISIAKKDRDTVRITHIYLWVDENAAADVIAEYKGKLAQNPAYWQSFGYSNVQMTQNGKYVTWVFDQAIDDLYDDD